MAKEVNLTEATVYNLRGGVKLKVYPASLQKILEVEPKLKKLETAEKDEKEANLKTQVEDMVDIIHTLVKEDNPDMTKEMLLNALSVDGAVKIIQSSVGRTFMLGE